MKYGLFQQGIITVNNRGTPNGISDTPVRRGETTVYRYLLLLCQYQDIGRNSQNTFFEKVFKKWIRKKRWRRVWRLIINRSHLLYTEKMKEEKNVGGINIYLKSQKQGEKNAGSFGWVCLWRFPAFLRDPYYYHESEVRVRCQQKMTSKQKNKAKTSAMK